MDFWKVIYENVGKKPHSFHNQQICIYRSQTFWSFMKFHFVHIVKVYFVFKNSNYAYIPPYIHKTLPALVNEKEQQKLHFMKNRWTS